MSSKSIKTKPHFYACLLSSLQEIAKFHGYNLIVHGSMDRDLDLVAIPWVDEPKTHIELLEAFCEYLGVPIEEKTKSNPNTYLHTILPGGRYSYVINLNRECYVGADNKWTDPQYYLDISFTPLVVAKTS